MTLPKISIIIVTYNAASTLQACLDSIYRQKYAAIEIVVIDGESTDGTIDIIKQNAGSLGYWVSEKDAGIYDAMNKGLKHATGQWIYFLGADDILFDGFSDLAIELKDKKLIYYSRVMTLGGPTIPANAYDFAKYGLCHQAMIYPREVFEGREFDTRYPISADYAFNMALFNSGQFRFVFKDHLVANFNQTGVSSTSIDKVFEQDRSALVKKHFGSKIWLRFLFWRFKKGLKKKR
ncbi:glycosyltransferase family 2 protein [Mucilaginibacter calamicampi]|uniref:Glycosyltransferase family 2 protein n=1 Tax=Mucilaginibacter calamicampi TaxID=1302352 RepID=A0ABW2Z1A4_9SPHI